MDNKDKKTNSRGYTFGYICGGVVVGCMMAVVVGVTIKFLCWLF